MIRTVPIDTLGVHRMAGIEIRDHFRKTPENFGGPRYCLGPLRTLAETTIEPGSGFPMHDHAEMEIVSYVVEGALVHADTLGNTGRLVPGDVQAMTTGTGIRHSEANGGTERVRMYQVWIEPDVNGLAPSYVDAPDPRGGETGRLCVLASGMASWPGGARINVDAAILGAKLAAGEKFDFNIASGRQAYVVAARGRFDLGEIVLPERHGAELSDIETVTVAALEDGDVLVFDLPVR